MKRTTLSNHITMLDGKLPVLKMAAVYGANGAGKSNLLKGINFLKAIATNKNFLNGDSVGRYMFALKEDAGDESIELTIEFATKSGIPFIYSVEIAKTGITFETLQVSGLGAEEVLLNIQLLLLLRSTKWCWDGLRKIRLQVC